jgi:hypothetical protein
MIKGFNKTDAVKRYCRTVAKRHLPVNERLLKAAIVQARGSRLVKLLVGPGVQPWYCVALCESGLTVIRLDFFFRKALTVDKYPFEEMTSASYKRGWLRDTMTLRFRSGQQLEFEVMRLFRAEAAAIRNFRLARTLTLPNY